jgi:AraC-like DNA-binding protein
LARGDASIILLRMMALKVTRNDITRGSPKAGINQSKRISVVFRASNEEPSEHSVQVLHSFAPEGGCDLRIQPTLFGDDLTNCANSAGPVRSGLPPRVVRRLREHIDNNIEQRISVEALAKLANLSVGYFVRAFKQSVGVTPHDYLIRRRVERTMELLSGTDMPISEIALAAGFADQSHCARRFRQYVGVSPRDYRWLKP